MNDIKCCPFCGCDKINETADQFICPVCGTSSDIQSDRDVRIKQWNDWCDTVDKFSISKFTRCILAGIKEPVRRDYLLDCMQRHMNNNRKLAAVALRNVGHRPIKEVEIVTDEWGNKFIAKTHVFWDMRGMPNDLLTQSKLAHICCAMRPNKPYTARDIVDSVIEHCRNTNFSSMRVNKMIADLNEHAGYDLITYEHTNDNRVHQYTKHVPEHRYPSHMNMEVME